MESNKIDKISDKKLVELVKNENELAFNQLFDKYWKSMVNTAFKVLKDRDVAHDIVQDIFVDFWSKRATLSIEHVSSYLHTAVKYRVINFIQKNKVPMTNLDFVDGFKNVNTTEELINLNDLNEVLIESISELPPKCRQVFRMSRFDHLSNKEIAEKLGLSVRTVENHIAHAIRLLKPKLKNILILIVILFSFLC